MPLEGFLGTQSRPLSVFPPCCLPPFQHHVIPPSVSSKYINLCTTVEWFLSRNNQVCSGPFHAPARLGSLGKERNKKQLHAWDVSVTGIWREEKALQVFPLHLWVISRLHLPPLGIQSQSLCHKGALWSRPVCLTQHCLGLA